MGRNGAPANLKHIRTEIWVAISVEICNLHAVYHLQRENMQRTNNNRILSVTLFTKLIGFDGVHDPGGYAESERCLAEENINSVFFQCVRRT